MVQTPNLDIKKIVIWLIGACGTHLIPLTQQCLCHLSGSLEKRWDMINPLILVQSFVWWVIKLSNEL